MDGCDVGGMDRRGPLVNVISPCMDVEVFSAEDKRQLENDYLKNMTIRKMTIKKNDRLEKTTVAFFVW
jgi:hypothetical protein